MDGKLIRPRCPSGRRGVPRDMQERPREQCGSIGPTQIVRRRLERCLEPGLAAPRTRGLVSAVRVAQNLVLVRRAVRVCRVAPLRPR